MDPSWLVVDTNSKRSVCCFRNFIPPLLRSLHCLKSLKQLETYCSLLQESWGDRFITIAEMVKIALRQRDKRDFTDAAHYFSNSLDALLPWERTLLPGLSLLLHLGHATMRASLQTKPSRSLNEAKAAFASCQRGATALVGADSPCSDYALQLLAATLQGTGWCELIAADVTECRSKSGIP
jgi:hypothetical protein